MILDEKFLNIYFYLTIIKGRVKLIKNVKKIYTSNMVTNFSLK